MPILNVNNPMTSLPRPQEPKPEENPLLPHQQRLVNRLLNPASPGAIAYWTPGAGKGRSAVETYRALGFPKTTAVLPAALKTNFKNEITKWLKPGEPNNINLVSQQLLARNGLGKNDAPFMIVDESQKSKDIQSKLYQALRMSKAKKKLALSGTPHPNNPSEIAGTINLIAGKNVLPTNKKDFYDKYVDSEKVSPGLVGRLMGIKPGVVSKLKHTGELKRVLNRYVDFYKSSPEGYPTVKEETVKVPMGANQNLVYKAIQNNGTWWQRYKVKHQLPPSKSELSSINSFLSGSRLISDSNAEFIKNKRQEESPKAQKAFNYFYDNYKKNPNFRTFVFSQFLKSGLGPYEALLKSHSIPYGKFTGNEDKKTRDAYIKNYNTGKIPILLGSNSAREGLNLLGTRLVQLMEPAFNAGALEQAQARAIRYKSHAHLPENERNVLIQKFIAEPKSSWLDKLMGRGETTHGTDEYLYNLSNQKELLNKQLMSLLQSK